MNDRLKNQCWFDWLVTPSELQTMKDADYVEIVSKKNPRNFNAMNVLKGLKTFFPEALKLCKICAELWSVEIM